MNHIQKAGLTLAAGLMAAGCSTPEIHAPWQPVPAETSPNTGSGCAPSGYTDRFVGYWALQMDGPRVVSEDTARAEEVLDRLFTLSVEVRERNPGAGYGGLGLLAVLTHEQTQQFPLHKEPGSVQELLERRGETVMQRLLDKKHGASIVRGPVDAEEPTEPAHFLDPSVPKPTETTAYLEATYMAPETETCA